MLFTSFFLHLPPYTIISKKQEGHNYPDPYISQKWPIRYSSLQKRKTAVLRDSKVMWMELHQPNKQNKKIQYNLIVSSLNGTTIRLREIYKVSCRAHFFLRSNAGFKVNISRSDAIRMMSAVKILKMAIMIWQKKILHFQCFLLDCQIWAERSPLCKTKRILQIKLGLTVTWSASLYHTHFFGCYCLFTLFINYYRAFSEETRMLSKTASIIE